MENLDLNATNRDPSKKAKYIRQDGRIPAVVYGKGEENLTIDFDYQEFRKLYEKAGHNTLINLQVEGAKEPIEVLIYTVDYDPVSGEFEHVDIRRITRGVEITTEVSITFEGVSEAVKTLGGVLLLNREYIDIKCLPRNLIHEVKADLSKLVDFNSKLTVADIEIPETVTLLNDLDELVATVNAPRAVVEDEEVEAEATEGEASAEGEAPAEGEEKKEEANG